MYYIYFRLTNDPLFRMPGSAAVGRRGHPDVLPRRVQAHASGEGGRRGQHSPPGPLAYHSV